MAFIISKSFSLSFSIIVPVTNMSAPAMASFLAASGERIPPPTISGISQA